jgi:Family of unknown function (DUF5908)
MAIEIREIHIKAVVNESTENAKPLADSAPPKSMADGDGEHAEQLISHCVEKVMEILKEKLER